MPTGPLPVSWPVFPTPDQSYPIEMLDAPRPGRGRLADLLAAVPLGPLESGITEMAGYEQLGRETRELTERQKAILKRLDAGDESAMPEALAIQDELNRAFSESRFEAATRNPNLPGLQLLAGVAQGVPAALIAPSLAAGRVRNLLAGAIDPAGQAFSAGIETAGRAIGPTLRLLRPASETLALTYQQPARPRQPARGVPVIAVRTRYQPQLPGEASRTTYEVYRTTAVPNPEGLQVGFEEEGRLVAVTRRDGPPNPRIVEQLERQHATEGAPAFTDLWLGDQRNRVAPRKRLEERRGDIRGLLAQAELTASRARQDLEAARRIPDYPEDAMRPLEEMADGAESRRAQLQQSLDRTERALMAATSPSETRGSALRRFLMGEPGGGTLGLVAGRTTPRPHPSQPWYRSALERAAAALPEEIAPTAETVAPRQQTKPPRPYKGTPPQAMIDRGEVKPAPGGGWQWPAQYRGERRTPGKSVRERVLAFLRGQPGVREEEIKWTGLEDWLAEQKQPVTRDEVLDYLAANRVEVREVMRSEPKTIDARPIWDALKRTHRSRVPIGYAGYGALPDRATEEEVLQILARSLGDGDQAKRFMQRMGHAIPGPQPKWASAPAYLEEGPRTGDRELVLTLPGDRSQRGAGGSTGPRAPLFSSKPHYDEPNVLAWVRFNERTDADGKRVLFVEEIQSDWGQGGAKEGFRPRPLTKLPEGFSVQSRTQANGTTAYWVEGNELMLGYPSATADDAVRSAIAELNDQALGGSTIPDAPLVRKWAELAMRRMVRYAADNGYERVAWTPGWMQARRYGAIVEDVEALAYDPTVQRLRYKVEGEWQVKEGVAREQLPAYIGRETAEALLRSPAPPRKRIVIRHEGKEIEDYTYSEELLSSIRNPTGPWGRAWWESAYPNAEVSVETLPGEATFRMDAPPGGFTVRTLVGKDVTYDVRAVNEANRLGKGFGVTAGETRIDTGTGEAPRLESVHSLDISPEMRRSVTEEGLDLFPIVAGTGAGAGGVSDFARGALRGAAAGAGYESQQEGATGKDALRGALIGAPAGALGAGALRRLVGETPDALVAIGKRLGRAAQQAAGQTEMGLPETPSEFARRAMREPESGFEREVRAALASRGRDPALPVPAEEVEAAKREAARQILGTYDDLAEAAEDARRMIDTDGIHYSPMGFEIRGQDVREALEVVAGPAPGQSASDLARRAAAPEPAIPPARPIPSLDLDAAMRRVQAQIQQSSDPDEVGDLLITLDRLEELRFGGPVNVAVPKPEAVAAAREAGYPVREASPTRPAPKPGERLRRALGGLFDEDEPLGIARRRPSPEERRAAGQEDLFEAAAAREAEEMRSEATTAARASADPLGEGIVIARTKPRELLSEEGGEMYFEYRLRHPSEAEVESLYRRFGGQYAPFFQRPGTRVVRERRRVTVVGGMERPEDWQIYDLLPDPATAAKIADSFYMEATSLHPIHEWATRSMREAQTLGQELSQLGDSLKPRWGDQSELAEDFQQRYYAALREARLYKAAQEGKAPEAQLKKIQRPLQAEYQAELKRRQSRIAEIEARLKVLESNEDAPPMVGTQPPADPSGARSLIEGASLAGKGQGTGTREVWQMTQTEYAVPGMRRMSLQEATGVSDKLTERGHPIAHWDEEQKILVGAEGGGPWLEAHEFGHALTMGEYKFQPSEWIWAIEDTPGAAQELPRHRFLKTEFSKARNADPTDPANYEWGEAQAYLAGEYARGMLGDYPALRAVVEKLGQATPDSRLGRLVQHRQAVERALAEGKPVPPEVLADYPDPAARQGGARSLIEGAGAREAAPPPGTSSSRALIEGNPPEGPTPTPHAPVKPAGMLRRALGGLLGDDEPLGIARRRPSPEERRAAGQVDMFGETRAAEELPAVPQPGLPETTGGAISSLSPAPTETTETVDLLQQQIRAIRAEMKTLQENAPNPRDFPKGGGYDAEAFEAASRRYQEQMSAWQAEAETLATRRNALQQGLARTAPPGTIGDAITDPTANRILKQYLQTEPAADADRISRTARAIIRLDQRAGTTTIEPAAVGEAIQYEAAGGARAYSNQAPLDRNARAAIERARQVADEAEAAPPTTPARPPAELTEAEFAARERDNVKAGLEYDIAALKRQRIEAMQPRGRTGIGGTRIPGKPDEAAARRLDGLIAAREAEMANLDVAVRDAYKRELVAAARAGQPYNQAEVERLRRAAEPTAPSPGARSLIEGTIPEPAAESRIEPPPAGTPPGAPPPARPVRFATGKALAPEERKTVLASVVDVYRPGGSRVLKGVDRESGDEIYGWEHRPDLFVKSDVTGRPTRYYVTLPDGRKAHPSELFPNLSPNDVEREVERQASQARKEADHARLEQEAKQSRIIPAGAEDAKGTANDRWAKTGRYIWYSYFARNEAGDIVRVDGLDPKDVAYYQERGFARISVPVSPRWHEKHKAQADIENLLKQGVAVPPEILADYPDLAARQGGARSLIEGAGPPEPPAPPGLAETPQREALARRIAEATREPQPQIAAAIELLGTDGKWYGPNSFPHGIRATGQQRTAGYSWSDRNGIRYGQRAASREELVARHKATQDAKVEQMYQAMLAGSDEDLQSQAAYWLKEPAQPPPPAPTRAEQPPAEPPRSSPTAPPRVLTGSAEDDARLARLRQRRARGRGMTAGDESSLEHLEAMAKADPSKWQPGDGVGWRATRDQINRGFRVVAVDPERKLARIRQVADTGLTTSGGDYDRIGDEWVHVADLVRDRRYNKPATKGVSP